MIELVTIDFKVLYFVLVGLFFLGLLFWGLYEINKTKKSRLEAVSESDINEPIETHINQKTHEKQSKKRARKNIETRFIFLRRFFIPVVVLFAGLFALLPFMSALSAAYVSVVAGGITVLVGIAARPFIENAFAGIVITLSQPIRINDTVVIDNMYGTVERITLTYTVIKIWNWRRFHIPNSRFLQKEFENLSTGEELEWTHVSFHVSPRSDIEKVKMLAIEAIKNDHLLPNDEPTFWVTDLTDRSIECWIAGWAETPPEAWSLRTTTRENLAKSLSKHKIDFQMSRAHASFEGDFLGANVQGVPRL